MRFLAIDLGDKRTGVALGDSETRLVSPLPVVDVSIAPLGGEGLLLALLKVIEDQLGKAPGELVVGLPLNMDGSEGPRARGVRSFAARLGDRSGRIVNFQDERLTSAAADWTMARSGMTHAEKKQRRDALAAAAILSDFLSGLAKK